MTDVLIIVGYCAGAFVYFTAGIYLSKTRGDDDLMPLIFLGVMFWPAALSLLLAYLLGKRLAERSQTNAGIDPPMKDGRNQ